MKWMSIAGMAITALLSVNVMAQYKGLGTESVSAETLKKYAPPALNPVMTNKLKKMFDVTAPGMGMLSPDKKTLFFTWRVTGISHVWKIDGPQKFPVQLTSGSDAVTLADIAPNGKFLIISKDTNGEENPGIYKLELATGQITELYRKAKVQSRYDFITEDSKTIYFTANDTKPDSYNIYKMDLASGEKTLIYEGSGYWGIADQRDNGKDLLFYKATGSKTSEFYAYDQATKKLDPVIGVEEKGEFDVAFAAKKGEYLVLTPKEEFKRLYLFNPAKSKDLKPLTDGKLKYDVSGYTINEKRTRITYNVNREGYTELYAMDAKTFKPLTLPKFKGADHVFAGKTTRDDSITMLGVISAQTPRVSYTYNWNTKQMVQWVLPSAPEVDLKSFAIAELMTYETRDGVKIPMFVRFPKGCKEKTCPVVVHFHGGPEGQSEAGFSPLAQAFVDEGFIFAEPNVRGSDGYGKTWIDMDNGPKRENVITDVEDAAAWMKKNWARNGVTPKIGVMGWSYGGYSTLLAMTRFAGAYNAGVGMVGMSDLVSFLNNTAPYRRILRITEYGDPEKDKEALIKLSPITYVNQVRDPLMIIQGANDPRVPVGEAIQIQETLQKKKIESQLIVFADEGHGSSKKENQVLEIGHTIEFFKKNLN
ncbi:MAG: prolyl oligopeptidase family serine peptidase [Pseudobdellovibrio sp.]|nr:prolyl oligopeptidase family serine peptidase [Pseudobdellovibrio sp.]